MNKMNNLTQIEPGKAWTLAELTEYAPGAVVSRTIHKTPAGTITVFAFDEGQELSEHSTPFNAYVVVIDGKIELKIGGQAGIASEGDIVLMPKNIPHAVSAHQKCKMMLIMIKE
jgi:quercetin dioxygenase-like cupin family protein